MLGSVFLVTLKQQIMQNVGREFFDESVYYTVMTEGLQDIYFFLNTKRIRAYSFVEETLTPTTAKHFYTTYSIMGIVKEKDGHEQNTGVRADGQYYLTQKHFATNESFVSYDNTGQIVRQYTYIVDQTTKTGISGIKTSEEYGSVVIRYFREPVGIDVDTITNQLDIPETLTRALRQYCMMELLPGPYMDTGANMSQFYYSRYKDALQMYANAIGSDIDFNFTSR